MKTDHVNGSLDDKLSLISEKLDVLSEKVSNSATKDDLISVKNDIGSTKDNLKTLSKQVSTKKDLKNMERRLTKRFDSMDKALDKDLATTMQRVKHIEDHIDIPPFIPTSPS